MRFDHTNGKEAKYMVSVYAWNVEDKYICADYKHAKELFNRLKESDSLDDGTCVSVYDLKKDVRKLWHKVER